MLVVLKTKNILHKRVTILSILLLLLFANSRLYSQIIYTDIPDATPNATYSLDLNNDTVVDFIIYFGGSGSTIGVMCNPQNNNAYSGNFINGTYLPWALLKSGRTAASVSAPAIKGVDSLNNHEMVEIDTPTAGNSTIRIAGTAVPQGPVKFYVVYQFKCFPLGAL
jgi:hypothetical protein